MEDLTLYAVRHETQTLTATASGDWTGYNGKFTVKENREQNSDRIIDKDVAAIVYDSNKDETTFTIDLTADESSAITKSEYDWDIECTNITDSTDIKTPVSGKIYFKLDVRLPNDGTTITTNKQTVTEVNASDFDENDMLQVQTVSGSKKFVGKNKTEVKQFLDIDKFLGFKTYAEIMAIDTSSFTGAEMVVKIDGTPTILLWNKTEGKWQ